MLDAASCNKIAIFVSLAVLTLEVEQIIWTDKSSGICPSDLNLCCTALNLFDLTDKSSGKNRLSRQPNIRRFVRLRQFVHPDDLFVL